MGTFADGALAAVFGAWLLATVACQAPSRLHDWLRQRDIWSLIPRWHFFAPTPGMQDFVLVYRDQARDGSVCDWREAPGMRNTPPPLCWVWNPARRHTKALLDITKELTRLVTLGRAEREIQLSVPYLALLNHVSRLPRLGDDLATQFALVMSRGTGSSRTLEVLLVSGLHELEPPDRAYALRGTFERATRWFPTMRYR